MPLITLTTDFGEKDHYVALMKGRLYTNLENLTLVDISHEIKPFDIFHASYLLNQVKENFPDETIHMVAVNMFYQKQPSIIAIRHHNQWFVGPDNGIFSLIWDDVHELEIRRIKIDTQIKPVDLIQDVLIDTCIQLAHNSNVELFSEKRNEILQSTLWKPILDQRYIRATIVYFDRFENAIVNLRQNEFEAVRQGRKFLIIVGRNEEFEKISDSYADVEDGDKVCFFNSAGFLEIAINKGNAEGLMGLQLHDNVQIEFQ